MSTGKIIITAKGADAKLINRLLLHVRDWEYGEEGTWDTYRILRTRDEATAADLPVDTPPVVGLVAGKLSTQNSFQNQWEGLSVKEVEKLMLIKDDAKSSTSLFMILDDRGCQDQTIIVVHRAMNWDGDSLYLPEYNKVRVPWQEAYIMWCNLDIANMDFEDYCDQEVGAGEDRWWTYKSIEGVEHYVDIAKKRDAAIKELEKLDLA